MPQINRIRVNNVKYNFGTQYYDDFMMRFNCKNTIYDLANGGGKSLLMLLLLQNVIPNCTLDEKQPIEKLFRTGCDNTVIHSLVEWKLDACYRKDNYKYMTTGFCARKGHVRDEYAQEVESSDTVDISDSASIEYFNYCIFYRKFGDNDIKNIPLVKNGERVTYNGLKAYLRELEKNDFNVSVKIFDRKGDYQNFISRYGLFESEWEIIRGINKTEGHVRTYFETNYRTSRKVVEDLLIEEIIQKSFNNKLAVTDDEGKMAKTLLDIKDKLIELSKKNERISSYNSQMSALDDFAEYVSTFKEMYSKKEQLKKCLYNMLIKAHCMLITKDEYFTSVENEAESNRLSEEEEQRKIQTAQVMAEQYSLKSIEALIAENEKAREYDNNRLIQLQDKLRLMESANDYNDYIQYDKAMYEAQLAVNSVLRDNKEIIEELSVIAKAYKILYDTDIKKLEEELVTAKNKYEESGIKYAECNNNISEYEKKLAACESMSEYIASEIKEEEGQLAKLMGIAGLIVAENAQEEYDKNIDRIEQIGHEQQNIKIQCDKKERKLSDIRYELSGIAALNKYLVNEYERQKQDKSDTDSVRQRIERLKKIYLTQNTESLVSVIHDTYDETYSELSKLKEKKERLKRFIVDTKDGRYSFDEPMINSLRKYLSLHYTGCFMQGHDWLKGYDDTTRVKLTEKYPFIEYAFIITDNFEKIGHDEVLKDFEKSAYMVPLVSSSIIDTLGDGNISNYNTTDDNIKPDNYIYDGLGYITFAGKNLSFLYDDARCNAQIKTAEEELDNVQENIEKLEDRCNILNEDYLFIIENNSSSFILEEQKLKDIAGKIQENKSREDKLKEEYENTKAAYNDELAEYNQLSEDFNSLNAAKPNFFPDVDTWEPYTIPDGVIFNCKDGRLVIEENTAKAYAIANPFKRVYWLNQGAQSFSIKECVVAIDIKSDTTWATSFQDRQVNILNGATLTVSVPMALDTVMMEEDAQVVFTATEGKLTARSLRFAPLLSATGWKAFGMPFTSAVIKNSTEEEISAPSTQNVDNGIWFARLKDNKTPEFVVDESAFGMAGLWAANGDTYTISSEGAFEFKTLEEPAAPTETGTFLMCSNPNTFTITLKQSAYILTADGTSFEQEANPEIKPFQSFVLTDAKTLSTLRSLRIGDGVVTGNQTIEPVDGYYVTTDRGAIVIHTPEPMDVVVIRMNGKVAYRGEVTDGQRIMVSSGIYAVNGQLVRVK